MKFIRQLLTLCVVIGATGGVASMPAAAADKDLVLKGDAKCTVCHDEKDFPGVLLIGKTKHGNNADGRTPTCTSCHGASEAHLKNGPSTSPDVTFSRKTNTSAEVRNGACLTCHAKDSKRQHWAASQHESGGVACASCHQVHAGQDKVLSKKTQPEVCFTCHKDIRVQTHKISTHPILAGKVACSDCHNPHGTTGPKLLVKNAVNATCYTCHAEKRGPFLWEHAPVNDECTNCHTPHGSTNTPLLNTRVPYLCQECHSGDHGNGINSASNLTGGNALGITVNGTNLNNTAVVQNSRAQLGARACLNCHVLIHGSNHPAGAKFQR